MQPSAYSLHRNDDILLKTLNARTKKILGDRAFIVAALKLFNALLHKIRHKRNLNNFKTLVKTFLFQNAYGL